MGSATRGLMHSGSPTGRSASLPLPRITETQRSERWPRPCLVVSQRWDRGRRSQQHGRTGPWRTYDTVDHFLADGLATPCPLTLVDAGQQSDHIIRALADRPHVTLIVTGIGPPAGSDDPSLQALYVLPVTAAGWLTSASTRRDGIVNLTDLTATLISAGGHSEGDRPAQVDGSPFEVRTEIVTAAAAQDHLEAVAALSDAALRADTALGVSGAILLVTLIVSVTARRFAVARPILGWGTVLPATMLLTGAVPWNATRWPVLVLLATLAGWSIALTVAVLAGANVSRCRLPWSRPR